MVSKAELSKSAFENTILLSMYNIIKSISIVSNKTFITELLRCIQYWNENGSNLKFEVKLLQLNF